jgi:predicted AAA+ superfamily ATPase
VTVELVAYADLEHDALVQAARSGTGLERELYGEPGGLPQALARRVLASTGPFATVARRGPIDDARIDVAARDLRVLAALVVGARREDAPTSGPQAALEARMLETHDWGTLAREIAAFHRTNGCGALATHRVLRAVGGALHGVVDPDPISLDDLLGREELRAPLLDDLGAFTSGQPANDALLYGPPGTGKSATVRACAAAFADRGLRLVQVTREDLDDVDRVFALVAGEGPWVLLFLDDLVFDDDARADRALRAALEGGVVRRPRNVLVWATSNRLNMTHQTHSEREDEIDEGEARGEKVALANRFGRRVRFDVRGESWYVAIVTRLVSDRLGRVPEGCIDEALRFARTGAGPRPRTAHHFAAGYRP